MDNKEKQVLVSLIITIILFFVIFYISIIPVPKVKGAPSHTDKVVHFFIYFWLAFFVFLSTRKAWLSFFMAGIYGFLIEAVQFTLPYRSFSFFDLIANFFGAGLILIVSLFYR